MGFQAKFKHNLWTNSPAKASLLCAVVALLMAPQAALADASFIEVVPGYTDQPALERDIVYSELEVPPPAPPAPTRSVKTSYTPLIFDHRISKELKDKYQRTFGDTQVELTHRLPVMGNEDRFSFRHLHRPEEDLEKQKVFREYMLQRLAEYNIDKLLRESRKGRVVHQVKEKVQNTKIKIAKKTEVRARFSLINRGLDVNVANPALDTRILWDPTRQDPYLILTRPISKKTSLRGVIDWEREWHRLTATQKLNQLLSANVTMATRRRSAVIEEKMVLAGLYYTWP